MTVTWAEIAAGLVINTIFWIWYENKYNPKPKGQFYRCSQWCKIWGDDLRVEVTSDYTHLPPDDSGWVRRPSSTDHFIWKAKVDELKTTKMPKV